MMENQQEKLKKNLIKTNGEGHNQYQNLVEDESDESYVSLNESDQELEAQSMNASQKIVRTKMITVSLVCVVLIVLEVIGGLIASSLAIISDAAHMLSDLLGFMISIMSLYLAQKKQNSKFTYGYHRSEIIGAICSIMMIWVITAFMVYEAIWRLNHITQITIDAPIMFITAVCGLIANLIMGTVLHHDGDSQSISHSKPHSHNHSHNHSHSHAHAHSRDHKHNNKSQNQDDNEKQQQDKNNKLIETTNAASKENYNMQAAMIHVIGDIVQSVGVVIASIVIWTDPNLKWFDPVCTLIFAIIVMCTTIPITGDCITVLMEAAPPGEDWDAFQDKMQKIPGVVTVLDFHVWSLASGKPCLSAHIISNNVSRTLRKATNMCRRNNIFHTTIQVELENPKRKSRRCHHSKQPQE